jgi:hypothetical protein
MFWKHKIQGKFTQFSKINYNQSGQDKHHEITAHSLAEARKTEASTPTPLSTNTGLFDPEGNSNFMYAGKNGPLVSFMGHIRLILQIFPKQPQPRWW